MDVSHDVLLLYRKLLDLPNQTSYLTVNKIITDRAKPDQEEARQTTSSHLSSLTTHRKAKKKHTYPILHGIHACMRAWDSLLCMGGMQDSFFHRYKKGIKHKNPAVCCCPQPMHVGAPPTSNDIKHPL